MTLPISSTNFSEKPTATSMRVHVPGPEAYSSSLVTSVLPSKSPSETLGLEHCAVMGENRKPNDDESPAVSTAFTERLNVAGRSVCTNAPTLCFVPTGPNPEVPAALSSTDYRESSEEAKRDTDFLEQKKPTLAVTGTCTRTPQQQHQLEKIPASADSSQDDMTLAEMEALIHRLAWQPPPSSNAMPVAADRNLMGAGTTAQDRQMPKASTGNHSSLLNTEYRTTDSAVNGRTFVQVATVAAEILPNSLNRCVPLPRSVISM